MGNKFKYIKLPTYTETEWSQRNPLLEKGEVGFLYVDGENISKKFKCGPGYWNDLEYISDVEYSNPSAVTNVFGDATGVLSGKTIKEILELMLNPFQQPKVSNVLNNAGGVNQNEWTLEIGQSVNNVLVQYGLSNTPNLNSVTPINIDAGGQFDNEGDFANGSITLTKATPIIPTLPTTITIKVKAKDNKGNYSEDSESKIKVYPKIIWGVSSLESLDANGFFNIGQKQVLVTDQFTGEFDFTAAGYGWIGIPAMNNPTNLIFADVTNPLVPGQYNMTAMGTLTVNNGLTTYDYIVYRTTNYQLTSSVLKIG